MIPHQLYHPLKLLPFRIILIFLMGCAAEESSTDELYKDRSIGVVQEAYAKLHTRADSQSSIQTLMRGGDIITIDFVTKQSDIQFGLYAPWYKVQYEDYTGWIFGIFLETFQEEHEALQYSKIIEEKFFGMQPTNP